MPEPIYLDHAATTPVRAEVLEAMLPFYGPKFGNPSSVHRWGRDARTALDEARERVARCIGATADEICFTSGGTEADNIAILGTWRARRTEGRRGIVTTPIEHKAVLEAVHHAAHEGADERICRMTKEGVVDTDSFRDALGTDASIASVMWINNEIGTIQPIGELAAASKAAGALFHTDAVQSAGKIPVNVKALGVDLLSVSAHKFYGPKGVGALWIRRGLRVLPLLTGGRQERSRRAGTENVPGIVGLGVAATIAAGKMESEGSRLGALRDRLEAGILRAVPGTAVNGSPDHRVPNTTNISFDRIEAESLLIALDLEGVAVSTGSACSSGTLEPSHVLKAMGFNAHRTQNSIRFSLGARNTDAEIDRVIAVLPGVVEKLRSLTRTPARA